LAGGFFYAKQMSCETCRGGLGACRKYSKAGVAPA
jgi:hypothetical protein